MLKRYWITGAALLLGAFPLAAMDAQSFYVKGSALNRQGAAALLTADFQIISAEMKSADKSVKAENDRAKAAGRPFYCAPATNNMTADQLLAEFRRIPQQRRQKISVRQAWREIVARKYPC